MARIEQVIDDLTGATLNEEVQPTTITVDGTDYRLDLGSASKDTLVKWLSGEGSLMPYKSGNGQTKPQAGTETGDAKPAVPYGTGAKYAAAKRDQMDVFRTWAKGQKIDLPAKGAPKTDVVDKFFADNPELPVLVGRNSISIEEWHSQQS